MAVYQAGRHRGLAVLVRSYRFLSTERQWPLQGVANQGLEG